MIGRNKVFQDIIDADMIAEAARRLRVATSLKSGYGEPRIVDKDPEPCRA